MSCLPIPHIITYNSFQNFNTQNSCFNSNISFPVPRPLKPKSFQFTKTLKLNRFKNAKNYEEARYKKTKLRLTYLSKNYVNPKFSPGNHIRVFGFMLPIPNMNMNFNNKKKVKLNVKQLLPVLTSISLIKRITKVEKNLNTDLFQYFLEERRPTNNSLQGLENLYCLKNFLMEAKDKN